MTRVAILGGGPAGVGAAYKLRREERAEVLLVEAKSGFGGNAGTFEWRGHRLDYGSHRLHPSCDADVMADIRELLGEELLDRPRHGRIRLLGRWVHFPLKPADLLLHLKPSFALGAAADAATKPFRKGPSKEKETFASVLAHALGGTICRHFYFPYARKIWGRDPDELSAIQAHKRVSAGSIGKLLRKVAGQLPGFGDQGKGHFFYPARGFGQISEAYARAAVDSGADLRPGTRLLEVHLPSSEDAPFRLVGRGPEGPYEAEADHVWSTLPLPFLARALRPGLPEDMLEQTERIHYRGMILIYLELDAERFTPYDAHYFPSEELRITRLSEPENYAARARPEGRTVLCAELPASPAEAIWNESDEALGELVVRDLESSGLELPGRVSAVTTRKLAQAYPIYLQGYEEPFRRLDAAVSAIPRLLSYGRQGLFAHDNTHHALRMAYAATECLGRDGVFDTGRWAEWRADFERHVVED